MSYVPRWFVVVVAIGALVVSANTGHAVSLNFVGNQEDIGDTFFPSGTPSCCVVPWSSDSGANVFAASDQSPDRYYGTAGYALFATQFEYPNANVGYSSSVTDPIFADNDYYIDRLDLPSFVTDSEILATRKAGGWAYALIDDPALQHGIRQWTFDGVNYPPADGTNTTGGIPYVKIGLLDGSDILGSDPAATPTARWGFEVGEDVPANFRVGVMTDGLDDTIYAAAEVFLSHVVYDSEAQTIDVLSTVSSGVVTRNRFVDMHFFDISGAQAGDQFVFSAMKGAGDPGHASAGISGFTFDVLPTAAGVPGDYNNDGKVNAADYTVWRNHLGETYQLDNEGAGQTEGLVTNEDYDFWKSQFGMGSGSGGGSASVSVPEPGTVGLLLVVAMLAAIARRRESSWRHVSSLRHG